MNPQDMKIYPRISLLLIYDLSNAGTQHATQQSASSPRNPDPAFVCALHEIVFDAKALSEL